MTKDGPTPEIAQLSFAGDGSTDSSKKPAVLVKWYIVPPNDSALWNSNNSGELLYHNGFNADSLVQ